MITRKKPWKKLAIFMALQKNAFAKWKKGLSEKFIQTMK